MLLRCVEQQLRFVPKERLPVANGEGQAQLIQNQQNRKVIPYGAKAAKDDAADREVHVPVRLRDGDLVRCCLITEVLGGVPGKVGFVVRVQFLNERRLGADHPRPVVLVVDLAMWTGVPGLPVRCVDGERTVAGPALEHRTEAQERAA